LRAGKRIGRITVELYEKDSLNRLNSFNRLSAEKQVTFGQENMNYQPPQRSSGSSGFSRTLTYVKGN
jgi:hypothetical protein